MLSSIADLDFSIEMIYCPFAILSTEITGSDQDSDRATFVREIALKLSIGKRKSGAINGASFRGADRERQSRPLIVGRG